MPGSSVNIMSGVKRRPGPVRQLSLQATSTSTSTYLPGGASLSARRNQLRKQSSEDIWHSGGSGGGTPPLLCVGGSRSTPTVSRTRPPPVRMAWTEQRRICGPLGASGQGETPADTPKVEVEVVARKCTIPQPRTRPPPKLSSNSQQESALDGSRQRLAERLRLAWQQSAPPTPPLTITTPAQARARTNLDIFLAHNSNSAGSSPQAPASNQVITPAADQDCSANVVSAENYYIGVEGEKEDGEEDRIGNQDEELRSRSFRCQKSGTEVGGKRNDVEEGKMMMNNKEKEMREGKSICISITDRPEEDFRSNNKFSGSELEDEDDDDETGRIVQQRMKSSRNKNVVRGCNSMTSSPDLVGCAAKKAEPFLGTPSASRSSTPGGHQQNRTDPPRRLMSAPPQPIPRRPVSQQEKSSPIIQQSRRKLKSARRKQQKPEEEDISSGEDNIEQKPRRSRSARTSEVITMVSLLSPGQSEQEEEDCVTMVLGATTVITGDSAWQDGGNQRMGTSGANCGSTGSSPAAGSPFLNGSATNPILCIRKPVKTVSFQQQTGARSYANNFPSRRGAAILPEESHNPAPPVLRSTSLVAATSSGGSGNNKTSDQNPAGAALKRKLVRARSSNETGVLNMMSNEEDEEDKQSPTTENVTQPIQIVLTSAKSTTEDNKNSRTFVDAAKDQKKAENAEDENEDEDETDDVPEFKTPKEQECWDLFRRMVDKGITVSFETVLRGMLTPTEYRLRRHNLLTS